MYLMGLALDYLWPPGVLDHLYLGLAPSLPLPCHSLRSPGRSAVCTGAADAGEQLSTHAPLGHQPRRSLVSERLPAQELKSPPCCCFLPFSAWLSSHWPFVFLAGSFIFVFLYFLTHASSLGSSEKGPAEQTQGPWLLSLGTSSSFPSSIRII